MLIIFIDFVFAGVASMQPGASNPGMKILLARKHGSLLHRPPRALPNMQNLTSNHADPVLP